jgi:hypothetical protein
MSVHEPSQAWNNGAQRGKPHPSADLLESKLLVILSLQTMWLSLQQLVRDHQQHNDLRLSAPRCLYTAGGWIPFSGLPSFRKAARELRMVLSHIFFSGLNTSRGFQIFHRAFTFRGISPAKRRPASQAISGNSVFPLRPSTTQGSD